MFIVDMASINLLKDAGVTFSNRERITAILLWPILALGVILGIFKQR